MGVLLTSHNQIVQYETPAVKPIASILERFPAISYRLIVLIAGSSLRLWGDNA
jgi:hypothetical protein